MGSPSPLAPAVATVDDSPVFVVDVVVVIVVVFVVVVAAIAVAAA
jgi:hypothetical protein